MHINAHTALSTPSVLLVPYSPHHVLTYHAWMQSPSLRAATASDALTLAEEFAMQASWRTDGDKLTFIICQPLAQQSAFRGDSGKLGRAGVDDVPERIVGDVNLFLVESEAEPADDSSCPSARSLVGELELMIASPAHRRRGYGRAALLAFISYISTNWERVAREYGASKSREGDVRLEYLRVKIQESNMGSVHLFKGLGFEKVEEEPNYFGEVELRLTSERLSELLGKGVKPEMLEYEAGEQDTIQAAPS